jgi:pimeloyl-ACP methyl ester carboxylesterase
MSETILPSETTTTATAIVTALAAVPERRDFAYSAGLDVVAWVLDDTVEWTGTAEPGALRRMEPGALRRVESDGALPPDTHLVPLSADRIGISRPTDAGVEILLIEPDSSGGWSTRSLGALATPRTCLLPRLPGAAWQYLAVADFSGACALWRIDWDEGRMTEAGGLPGVVDGGIWLDEAGHRLAVNLRGESGRSSVHVVDFEKTSYHLLFQVSPKSDDRVVLFHPGTNRLVLTSDAFGYPGVGLVRLGDPAGVRFLPPLTDGEEAGDPCAFVSGGRAVLLRHEDGVVSRLRLADVETLEVGPPLAVPEGEIGSPVESDGDRLVCFPFSAPDLPWRLATYDLRHDRFRLEGPPGPDLAITFLPARVTALPGPLGPTPALLYPPGPSGPQAGSDLAVVALHGGPIARWTAEYTGVLQLFAQLGVPVLALNYPGSTGSGQDHMRSLLGRAGSIDVEAVASVVDALTSGEGRRVILYGESYGGFLAHAVAAVRPCAGVITLAGFGSFPRLHDSGSPEIRQLLQLLDGGNPFDSGRNLLTDPRTNRYKVLIAHGTADRTVPVAESRELARALRGGDGAGEKNVRLIELDGQGHELSGPPALEHWYREIAHFVANLPQEVEIARPTSSPAAGALSRRPRGHQPERR